MSKTTLTEEEAITVDPEEIQTEIARDPTGDPFIEVANQDGKFHWMLFGSSGRALATSVHGYKRKKELFQALKQIRETFADPNLNVLQAKSR